MNDRSQRRGPHRWKGREDVRVICDCQRHARTRRVWRRAIRVATQSVALLVSIPLAFAAFDIPISASDINLDALRAKTGLLRTSKPQSASQLRIFTTPEMEEQFLPRDPRLLTLDGYKRDYYRQHIPYGEIIFREAEKNNLSPELVAAMVQTESDFRPRLISNKSAQGLMQIIPSTARLLGINNPFDPEQNIAAGTRYFRYLLDRFDDEAVALAAYNAGEGNVERYGGMPPFPETRDYVAKVNRRQFRYRQNVHSTYLAQLRVRRAITAN
ncbi:MAG TPA: lytic transglycosylase domain-containing protein [Thermoanaerobaculia bacterium]|nr:lytic transglycosylase domain-containing protein [Thermoanaerobaculia bacterium]